MSAQRKIIHIDMDCFYAQVEMRDNPEYQNKPIAVGGNSVRGVLCTCNYQARSFGVRSAMPNHMAKKLCPDLIIVNGRMAVYQEVSQQIRTIFSRYTDVIEPLSLDEAYLDVTGSELCQGSATLIAERIRLDIFNETQLTASAGIAPNKFLAKIASDENKPNGQCVVSPTQVEAFVEQLSLKKIPGIGPKTAKRLSHHGFENCRDVRESSIVELQKILGKQAVNLYHRSFGIDNRSVETSRDRKSLAVETTLAIDLSNLPACLLVLDKIYQKLLVRLENCNGRLIVKQGVKLKFADFNQTTVEQQSSSVDYQVFQDMLAKAYDRANDRTVRLVGLTLGFKSESVADENNCQLSLPTL